MKLNQNILRIQQLGTRFIDIFEVYGNASLKKTVIVNDKLKTGVGLAGKMVKTDRYFYT